MRRAALAVALALVACGCGRPAREAVVQTPIVLETNTYFASEVDEPTPIGAIGLGLQAKYRYLVAVRLSIGRGEIACVVRNASVEVARRRVARLGDDLVVIPAAGAENAELVLVHPPRTGPVELDVTDVTVYRVDDESAAPTAHGVVAAFERETGRLGDPATDNLVANADFASDDEVRGTPADWYAYVDTAFDATTHTLRVAGAAPERRPFLATGPIPVEAGRRYRATWRMSVERGAVAVRAVDYDELATIFAEPPAELGSPGEASVEFTPTDGVRAVRLRFEGPVPAVDTAFDVSIVQVEALVAR